MKKTLHTCIIKVSIVLLVFPALISSCKKLIEIPSNPPNQLPSSTVFADSLHVMSAVAGIYTNFKVAMPLSFSGGKIPVYTGLSADELLPGSVHLPQLYIYTNTLVATCEAASDLWTNAYADLYQINACIEGIGSSAGISASLKKQLLGEIKVVRALYYFNLVNIFGGVPLVTSTDYRVTQSLPKATIDQIYTQIFKDLDDASTALTVNYPSDGRARPNLYTAYALLAKVNLYRGRWQDAENAATQIIGASFYSLEDDLNKVFLKGSHEAIWQLPANDALAQTTLGHTFVPFTLFFEPDYSIAQSLLNAFEPVDQRKGSWLNSYTIKLNGINTLYYYPYKYKNNMQDAPTQEDYMIFRLADQFLIRAEARVHSNNLTGALADLNMIRHRAGLPNITNGSPDQILSSILHERQVELFCESGDRWFDLKRTDIIDAVLGAEKEGWKPYQQLYPIPALEIQQNHFLTQNPGY